MFSGIVLSERNKVQRIHHSEDGCGMKPEPFEIIVEFTPQSTKTGITYEAHKKGSLIRCKDCKYRITANCERFGIKRYTQSDSFCSWAEPKEK